MPHRDVDLAVPEVNPLVHEPARLRLLTFLAVLKSADFAFLHRNTGLSRGNLSVQMTRLAEAGLVGIDKSFVDNRPRTVYKLLSKGRKALIEYRKDMELVLSKLPEQ